MVIVAVIMIVVLVVVIAVVVVVNSGATMFCCLCVRFSFCLCTHIFNSDERQRSDIVTIDPKKPAGYAQSLQQLVN